MPRIVMQQASPKVARSLQAVTRLSRAAFTALLRKVLHHQCTCRNKAALPIMQARRAAINPHYCRTPHLRVRNIMTIMPRKLKPNKARSISHSARRVRSSMKIRWTIALSFLDNRVPTY